MTGPRQRRPQQQRIVRSPAPRRKRRSNLWLALGFVVVLAVGAGAGAWWLTRPEPLVAPPAFCVAPDQTQPAPSDGSGGKLARDPAFGVSFFLSDGWYEMAPRSYFGIPESMFTRDPNKTIDGPIRLRREDASFNSFQRYSTPVEVRDGESSSLQPSDAPEKSEWGNEVFQGASVRWRTTEGAHYVASVGCRGLRWTVRASAFRSDLLSGDVEEVIRAADVLAHSIRELPDA